MKKTLIVGAALLISACASETLFPSNNQIVSTPASEKMQIDANTGTVVGRKVAEFRNELNQIRSQLNKDSEALVKLRADVTVNITKYNEIMAAMETKLQLGTTPANPKMVALYNNAQNVLQENETSVENLNALSADTAALGTQLAALISSVRETYAVPGALDEDHANLRVLENGAEQTAVAVKNMMAEVMVDSAQQKAATQNARARLLGMNNAIAHGSFGPDNAVILVQPQAIQPQPRPHVMQSAPRPQTVKQLLPKINAPVKTSVKSKAQLKAAAPVKAVKNSLLFKVEFNAEDVNYKKDLESAINRALATNAQAKFKVEAVNPLKTAATADSKKYAAEIFAEMINLGIAPEDITIVSRAGSDVKIPFVNVYTK